MANPGAAVIGPNMLSVRRDADSVKFNPLLLALAVEFHAKEPRTVIPQGKNQSSRLLVEL